MDNLMYFDNVSSFINFSLVDFGCYLILVIVEIDEFIESHYFELFVRKDG